MIRRWWKRGIIFLVVCLFTAELLLQIAHLGIQWNRNRRWQSQLNAAQKSKIVVLCVGESTTEWGGEDSYPNLLEERLQELLPGKTVSVVNGGRAASNSGELHGMLPGLLESAKPDFVVFMMGINDALYLSAPGTKWWDKLRSLLGWSRVWRLAELVRSNFGAASLAVAEEPAFKHPNRQPVEWESPDLSDESTALLDAGKRALKERGGWERARKKFPEFLALNPGAHGHYLVASSYFWTAGQGKHRREALKYLEQAYHLDPTHKGVQWLLTILLADFPKNWGRVKKIARAAIRQGNVNADIYLALLSILRKEGKSAEANSLLQEAIEKSRGDTRQFVISSALDICEQAPDVFSEKACVGWWRQSLEEFPGNPRLLSKAPASQKEFANWRLLRNVKNYHLHPSTVAHYRAMVEEAQRAGAQVISMQYPTMDLAPLKGMLSGLSVVFADNQANFVSHLSKHPYESLFVDRFTDSFGHTTREGSDMIARSAAAAIVKMVR